MLSELVRRLRPQASHFDPETAAYRRLQERGYAPSALIDVGAYEGHWTRNARAIFGDLPTLMIEPQAAKRAQLTSPDVGISSMTAIVTPGFAAATARSFEQEWQDDSNITDSSADPKFRERGAHN